MLTDNRLSHRYLMEAKMMCCCINNLVQAQDNNANGIHANAYLLWDFNDLCESKHDKSQLMRHKGLHMEWSHI